MKILKIENRNASVKLDDVVTKGLIDPLIDKIATLYGDDAVRNEWTDGEIVAEASGALERLDIEIDSVGGSVQQGYRLYKTIMALRERGVEVVANITKTAASMGSVIAMGADRIRMADTATMMIHDAQATVRGDADSLRHVVSELDQVSDEIAGIYAKKTGHKPEAIRNAMKGELHMGAQTALKYRFVDEVYEAEQKERNPSILERMIGNRAECPNAVVIGELEPTLDSDMGLFTKTDTEAAQAKIDSLEAENTDSLTEIEALREEVKNLAAEISDFRDKQKEVETEIEAKQEEIKTLTETIEAKDQELQAEKEKTSEEAINSLVTKTLATAGHPPIEADASGDALSSGTPHLDKFEALSGAAASSYFKKYKNEIRAEMRGDS